MSGTAGERPDKLGELVWNSPPKDQYDRIIFFTEWGCLVLFTCTLPIGNPPIESFTFRVTSKKVYEHFYRHCD